MVKWHRVHTQQGDVFWKVIRTQLDPGAYIPIREHETDAGADIRTPFDVTVRKHGSAIVHTGVHVELPPKTVGMLKSKSGLNINDDLISTGVIDEGYSGEIVAKLYNLGDKDVFLPKGSKVTQLVIMPTIYPIYEQAEKVIGGDRGDDGFGSTGR